MVESIGTPLASGRTAEVFLWRTDTVLKLYRSGWPAQEVEREFALVKTITSADIQTPQAHGVETLADRVGIVFDRIDGPSLLHVLLHNPADADHIARQLAALHAALHATRVGTLPDLKHRLAHKIEQAESASTALRAMALAGLRSLPEGDRLCHGDFHPDNVILNDGGPIVIDWVDATAGAPAADVARTLLLMRHGDTAAGAVQVDPVIQELRGRFCRSYLDHYMTLVPVAEEEIERWLVPVTVGRLSDGSGPEEQAALLNVLDQIDSSLRISLARLLA